MSDLLKNGWCHLPNLLNENEIEIIKENVLFGECMIDVDGYSVPGTLHNKNPKHEPMRGNVLKSYTPFNLGFIVKNTMPLLEELIGEELLPTFWFSTIYFNKSYLCAHRDRPSCEVSVTVNIHSSVPWEIKLKDFNGKTQKIVTPPGNAIAYLGPEVLHWRSPLRTHDEDKFIQFFMHYVRKNGKFSDLAYDQDEINYNLLRL